MIISAKSYYSNGKLLLTGEYLVMYGAKALAIPVKFGQSISITEHSGDNKLVWVAKEYGKNWFKAVFSSKTLTVEEYSDIQIVKRLQKIINEAKLLNQQFIKEDSGYLIETNLNFNRYWGLGTSSTLISNIALWANIDPFWLNRKVSNGSGYDIACAESASSIIYQLNKQIPVIKNVSFNPIFRDKIYFIYLEKKQDSAASIEILNQKQSLFLKEIKQISDLTEKFLNAGSIEEVIPVIKAHETIISSLLNIPAIQNTLFPDFTGIIKSLGAWGGDFIMAISSMNKNSVEQYFRDKGFPVIIPFDEMVLNSA